MGGLHLGLLGDLGDESLGGVLGVVGVPVVNALLPHVVAQVPPVRNQPRDGDPHMVVHLEHLLLVRRQVVGALLEGSQHLHN